MKKRKQYKGTLVLAVANLIKDHLVIKTCIKEKSTLV